MTSKGPSLRIQLHAYPSHHLTSFGMNPYLLPEPSYLHILNSLELIKFNTSTAESLKIGESFYLFFHFTKQYLYYDPLQEQMTLSRTPQLKTAFKIINDKINWTNRGYAQVSNAPNLIYRIVLAQNLTKYLRNQNGILSVSDVTDEYSLFGMKYSLYGSQLFSSPVRLTRVQNNLKLACKGSKTVIGEQNPTISTSMFMLKNDQKDGMSLEHVLSAKLINEINGEFVVAKQIEYVSPYIFHMQQYDKEKQLFIFKLLRNKELALTLPNNNERCSLSEKKLANVFKVQLIKQKEIMNIIPHAWLQVEREQEKNKLRIQFILNQCYELLKILAQQHEETVVKKLLNEGLLEQFQFTIEKYHSYECIQMMRKMIRLILQIKQEFMVDLLKYPKLYIKVTNDEGFIESISKVHIPTVQLVPSAYPQIIQNAYKLLHMGDQITLGKLFLLIAMDQILKRNPEQCKRILSVLQGICSQILNRVDQPHLSMYYLLGLRLLYHQASETFFQQKVLSQLSLSFLSEERTVELSESIKLKIALMFIQIVWTEKPLSLYIITDSQTSNALAKNYLRFKVEPHLQTLTYYMSEVLSKNCRFQTYESKVISFCVSHTFIDPQLSLVDCKEYIRNLIQNFHTYSYDDYQPYQFLQQLTKSLKAFTTKSMELICENNLNYDSLTTNIQQRTQKCAEEFEQIVSLNIANEKMLWDFLFNPEIQFERTLQIWLNILQIMQGICNSQPRMKKIIEKYQIIEEPSKNFVNIIQMFKDNYHKSKISTLAQYILKSMNFLSQPQTQAIVQIIDGNNYYNYFCCYHQDENMCKLLTYLITLQTSQSQLDGLKMLRTIVNLQYQWKYSDSEFNLMKNLLRCIGGVISMQVYTIFSSYIFELTIENYTLNFLQLCEVFLSMSPYNLKKQFVQNYRFKVFSSIQKSSRIKQILLSHNSQFIYTFIQLIIQFTLYHHSPDILYDFIGDETLFTFINKFNSIELKIAILKFMVHSRARGGAFGMSRQDKFVTGEDLQFLKEGTSLIRGQIRDIQQIKEKQVLLKEYTYIMIDFLKLREDLVQNSNNMPENDQLTIEGTNKLFAFELIDLIEITMNSEQIKKEILDKILWLEGKFKVNINSVEPISLEVNKFQEVQENFSFNYQLNESDSFREPVKYLINNIGIEALLAYLVRILSVLCFRNNTPKETLQLPLNYLHYLITHQICNPTEKNIQILFIVFRQLIREKEMNLVCKVQNILRKFIVIDGQLKKQNQKIIQSCIMGMEEEFLTYSHQILDQYSTFSPIYTRSENYFTKKGEHHVQWAISNYLSFLRFLNMLATSLNFQFKKIFSHKQFMRKQIIGMLVDINKEHIKVINDKTSKIKLTIIAYELELINNLLRGPVQENLKTVIEFDYFNIVHLLSISDFAEDEQKQESLTKLVIIIKKLALEGMLLIAPYEAFKDKQINLIEECLIKSYFRIKKIYGESEMQKIIVDYRKQNKNKIQMMFFDLTLSAFYCLVQIYEQTNNSLIKKLQTEQMSEARLKKSYGKQFKMFYQIYRVIVDLFTWIGKKIYQCCKKTATEIDQRMHIFDHEEETHNENLKIAFKFLVKNVANIEIQIQDKIQTVYFLLTKQARAYNTSIRKELHRRVGISARKYRLIKFLEESKYIIMRLQIEKSIREFTQQYKLIDMIIKNRQLWKSSNFLCACLLNFFFLEQDVFANTDIALAILRGISYIFCIFLFLIYFVQNLPLKRKLAEIEASSKNKSKLKYLKSCLEIFNDKTLWFASIYFFIISISFIQLGFVALLMIDFFVRFKISKKVTQIITRPIIQLVLILLFTVQVAYLFTCYESGISDDFSCPNIGTCIQLTYRQYLGLNKNGDISTQFLQIKARQFAEFYVNFFNIMLNNSLLISVLLYEKKAKNQKQNDWEDKVKRKCFICDGERSNIDRDRNNNKGFFQHTEEQHNLWNYIFYLIYLKNKNPSELNTVETMVLEKWNKLQIEWLPDKYRKFS